MAIVQFIGCGRSTKVIKTVVFFYPIYRVKKAVDQKGKKRINLIRFKGLIRSFKIVYYKVSKKAILLTGSTKYTIGRHLGSKQGAATGVEGREQ